MKGIFIITLALCLNACASQPEKVVTAAQPAVDSTEQTQPSNVSNTGSSNRAYLDDYDRVPFQTPPHDRGVRVLGSKKG